MSAPDQFFDLLNAALAWESPGGVCHTVIATPAVPLLSVVLCRASDRLSIKVDVPTEVLPGILAPALESFANYLLGMAECLCDECRAQALPSLDAAAAFFEASVEEIGGREP